MKILSWNVNGIRAVLGKGFLEFVEKENPDILCLQETKAHPDQVDAMLHDYNHYWNSAEKKGYSGTAIFSKTKPINVNYGMNIEKHDKEGRIITAEYDDFFLVTCYTPNSKRELERLDYRTKEWEVDFKAYLKNLEKTKPVVICGDLNVAHKEIDLANPSTNKTTATKPGNAGFTDQEREAMTNLIDAGFIDTFRELHGDEIGHYTWWSYMFSARSKNIGWRIDYFLISKSLKSKLKDSFILKDVMGSDHCPVGIEIDLK